MKMTFHNLKVAVRNLMKYKLQTVISVLSIAIGIVTLAFAHAAIADYKFPPLFYQPFLERAFTISLDYLDDETDGSTDESREACMVTPEVIRALKHEGGMKCAERIVVLGSQPNSGISEFHLCDSTVRKTTVTSMVIDPESPNYVGLRSAITGEIIKILKPGEGIISQKEAARIFGDANPIGAEYIKVSWNQQNSTLVTIVDVYENSSCLDYDFTRQGLYYTKGPIEDNHFTPNINELWGLEVVLREGYTMPQLQKEVDERLKPLGLKSKIKSEAKKINNEVKYIVKINSFVHLAGSLILFAAIIGFLRMQIQLIMSRHREVALRTIHGAKRINLFGMFFTETTLVVGLSVIVAIIAGNWVENLCNTGLLSALEIEDFTIFHLARYSLYTGLALLLLCGLVISISVAQVSSSGKGLAAKMRRSRSHHFRNAMLCLQVAISMVFVCFNLIVLSWSEKMLEYHNLPNNDAFYKKCILINMNSVSQPLQLREEIEHLPSLDKIIRSNTFFLNFSEIDDNPDLVSALNGLKYFPFYIDKDTSLLSFYDMKINWIHRPADNEPYLLLNEDFYQTLLTYKATEKGTLTTNDMFSYPNLIQVPIAGTIPKIPYSTSGRSMIIHPMASKSTLGDLFLIPKPGHYKSLMQEVEQTVHKIVPDVVDKIALNFRDSKTDISMIEGIRTVSWILGFVSIVICAMGIYSTIALDTRSRRKEMAVRKICGAKKQDIYRLFGGLYIIVFLLSLLISIPMIIIFREALMTSSYTDLDKDTTLSVIGPCLAGSLIIMGMIAAIVLWNIRSIMHTNPSEIIAKE